MSVAVRVIPCLDVDAGRVVKGVNFEGLRDAGDPVELAERYGRVGADELTFLDVTASSDERDTVYDIVARTAEEVFIPLTVGGGIRSVEHVSKLLNAGADKVSVATAAVENPDLINQISERFGSQVLTLSLDAKRSDNPDLASGYEVMVRGGRVGTGRDAVEWAAEAQKRGVGEVLLNSIDADGTQEGFDTQMLRDVRRVISVPLIASGGAGKPEHFPPAVEAGADAVLAASLFHFGPDHMMAEVKAAMRAAGIAVR